MSPQKLFFCYDLPTRGWARVKLGDAWYVSNVSIIFMLHACLYTNCFEFCYTLWRFYTFSETNLLTRCHSASSLFSAVLCFRKVTQEIFSELDETKAKPPIFTEASRRPKMRWRGATSQAHHQGAWPRPWPCHPMVRPAGPTSDNALSPISSPRWEKPKGQISFSWNILQAAAVARSGGSRSSSRHPAGEGNPYRRPSTSPWSPSEWCVSSLPWTMGP
jgi:hypothetical protein